MFLNYVLTHCGRVTHICISNLIIRGSDNGLSPGRCQAIIWTNAGILLIGPLGTNFSEIFINIYVFSFMKMHLKMSCGKWWLCCLTACYTTSLCLKQLTVKIEQKYKPFFSKEYICNFGTFFSSISQIFAPSQSCVVSQYIVQTPALHIHFYSLAAGRFEWNFR